MNENVQVINKNGDAMNTEGIAYIELSETGKKYLFYTLNEKVDNNLTKIYIAEVSETAGTANAISDTEWDDLRKKMVRISHKEEVPELKYLPMGNIVFNIGEPKKLAISDLNKQAFKDAQITHSIAANQTATPVVGGEPTFFATEPVSNVPVQETDGGNIFTNPPQLVETPTVNVETVSAVQPQTDVPVIPVEPVIVENPMSINSEAVTLAPDAPTIGPTVSMEQPVIPTPDVASTPTPVNATVDTPVIEDVPTIPVTSVEPVVPAEPTQTIPSQPTGVVGTQKTIITDEEALKAISVIQDYIEQEEEA